MKKLLHLQNHFCHLKLFTEKRKKSLLLTTLQFCKEFRYMHVWIYLFLKSICIIFLLLLINGHNILFLFQLLSPSNIATYGALCALATFDRKELQVNVISSRYAKCLHWPSNSLYINANHCNCKHKQNYTFFENDIFTVPLNSFWN